MCTSSWGQWKVASHTSCISSTNRWVSICSRHNLFVHKRNWKAFEINAMQYTQSTEIFKQRIQCRIHLINRAGTRRHTCLFFILTIYYTVDANWRHQIHEQDVVISCHGRKEMFHTFICRVQYVVSHNDSSSCCPEFYILFFSDLLYVGNVAALAYVALA